MTLVLYYSPAAEAKVFNKGDKVVTVDGYDVRGKRVEAVKVQCMSMYECMYIYTCIYVCICMYIHLHMHAYIHTYTDTRYIHIYAWSLLWATFENIYIYTCRHVCVCVCVCVYSQKIALQ